MDAFVASHDVLPIGAIGVLYVLRMKILFLSKEPSNSYVHSACQLDDPPYFQST